jgi:hypothetical protein
MTPTQKLIDLLKECRAAYERGTTSHDALTIAISFVKLNLQLERQAIEKAYKAGYHSGIHPHRRFENAEDYYNQTLSQADVIGSCEQPQSNNGDLVPLIWKIEELRRREGGCTMNELIAEVNLNFEGIKQIKHRTINYNAYNAGYSEGCNTIDPEGRKYKNAEDYYNKTFNQKIEL